MAQNPKRSTMGPGELARSASIHVETLRYYERVGLLPPPERRSSGHRRYDHGAVAILQSIRNARSLGLSVADIRAIVGAIRERGPDQPVLIAVLERSLARTVTALEQLEERRAKLTAVLDAVRTTPPGSAVKDRVRRAWKRADRPASR